MATYIEKFHDASQIAYECEERIAEVAYALSRVGLRDLANELRREVVLLNKAHKDMSIAVNEDLMRQVKLADGRIAEVFLAALSAKDENAKT